MTRKILLATLGEAPAVITEAIDLLTEQGARPDGVLLLHTEDPDVRESLELLLQHLPAHCGISDVRPVSVGSYGDIDSTEAAVGFMQIACAQLKTYREHRLFVSIAGGRKAMSALLALATQFYGAERLFHIWVPPWLEEAGRISSLRGRPEELVQKHLHPPLDAPERDRPKLIDLPFIALFPMLADIREALSGRSSPTPKIRPMLLRAGLLDADGRPTPLGQRVAEILELVETLPPARQREPEIRIPEHHYKGRLESFARNLVAYAPYITRVEGEPWRQGQPSIHIQPPNSLIIGVRLHTDILFRFRVTTTAHTQGELEAARQHLERYLQR
ncbi:MAG TPA: CRISPR-associated protein Csx14 [Thermoflexus sp.]|nr:CRISPR-associated protein Csx14 [Thermoflexus sp.]